MYNVFKTQSEMSIAAKTTACGNFRYTNILSSQQCL